MQKAELIAGWTVSRDGEIVTASKRVRGTYRTIRYKMAREAIITVDKLGCRCPRLSGYEPPPAVQDAVARMLHGA
jgi:hypothetical protein